jgi:hypothetical protein
VDFVLRVRHVHSGDLQVAVTGTAKAATDRGSTALTTLLPTALVFVGLILLFVYRSPVRSRARNLMQRPRSAR